LSAIFWSMIPIGPDDLERLLAARELERQADRLELGDGAVRTPCRPDHRMVPRTARRFPGRRRAAWLEDVDTSLPPDAGRQLVLKMTMAWDEVCSTAKLATRHLVWAVASGEARARAATRTNVRENGMAAPLSRCARILG
jgi:hypothetical protein